MLWRILIQPAEPPHSHIGVYPVQKYGKKQNDSPLVPQYFQISPLRGWECRLLGLRVFLCETFREVLEEVVPEGA